MTLFDICNENIAVAFRSKTEAVEFMKIAYDQFGELLEAGPDGFYYPDAAFYDKCVHEYGNFDGDEPAIAIDRIISDRGWEEFFIGYCNTQYFKGNGFDVVYYDDIYADLSRQDAELWNGDISNLLGLPV